MDAKRTKRVRDLAAQLAELSAELDREVSQSQQQPTVRAGGSEGDRSSSARRRRNKSDSVASAASSSNNTKGGAAGAAGAAAGAGAGAGAGKGPVTASGGDEDTTDDERLLMRPGLYPHAPRASRDSLEENKFAELDLMDALQLPSFQGFYNLAFMFLVFTLMYMTARNVSQHGLFVTFSYEDYGCPEIMRDITLAAVWLPLAHAFTLGVLGGQYALVKGKIRYSGVWSIYLCVQAVLLGCTGLLLYLTPISPPIAAVTLMSVLVLMMKLHSYVFTNYQLHLKWVEKGRKAKSLRAYPHTVNLHNFGYFLAAPSLVYEANFPRTTSIRWSYVAKKSAQMMGMLVVQYGLMAQFILPVLRGDRSTGYLALDLMKLCVPSFLLWLAGFYAIFHCFLNIIAELLMFSHRRFFADWWNATTIEMFWRLWNIPVHEWCLRHVYIESMHYAKVSRGVATFSTFLLSAVLHEVLFSMAFKTIQPWFFLGMLAQMPMAYISKAFKGRRRGNLLMWFGLFTGQPLLEMLYFRRWFADHDGFFCVDS